MTRVTIIEAPEKYQTLEQNPIFLGGGISNCPDWQKEMTVNILNHAKTSTGTTDMVTILNPRREMYTSADDARNQIAWEYGAMETLINSDGVMLFWFPEETLCPITLFELGRFTKELNTRVIVGVHPNYQRKLDVITQLQLARPDIQVVHTLQELFQQAVKELAL